MGAPASPSVSRQRRPAEGVVLEVEHEVFAVRVLPALAAGAIGARHLKFVVDALPDLVVEVVLLVLGVLHDLEFDGHFHLHAEFV